MRIHQNTNCTYFLSSFCFVTTTIVRFPLLLFFPLCVNFECTSVLFYVFPSIFHFKTNFIFIMFIIYIIFPFLLFLCYSAIANFRHSRLFNLPLHSNVRTQNEKKFWYNTKILHIPIHKICLDIKIAHWHNLNTNEIK